MLSLLMVLPFACSPGSQETRSPAAPPTPEAPVKGSVVEVTHDPRDVAYWVSVLEGPERDAWQRPQHVLDLLGVSPGETVVDLGAGTGYFLAPLSQAVGPRGRVLALEPESNFVAHMERRTAQEGLSNVEVRRIPYDDPLLDSQVDRVLVVNAWRHIEDRQRYAGLLAGALAAQGTLLVVDYDRDGSRGPAPELRLAAADVAEELRRSGFDVEIVDETLPDQFAVLAKRRAPPASR